MRTPSHSITQPNPARASLGGRSGPPLLVCREKYGLAAKLCAHRPAYSMPASGRDESRPYISSGEDFAPLLPAAGEKGGLGPVEFPRRGAQVETAASNSAHSSRSGFAPACLPFCRPAFHYDITAQAPRAVQVGLPRTAERNPLGRQAARPGATESTEESRFSGGRCGSSSAGRLAGDPQEEPHQSRSRKPVAAFGK